ncbi:hypothetical protein [Halalkalibacter hemicellulosilyticus]|uniref:Uncharacterized protein n=1 Tax=Halalkalibacter hemicellulosilyticusJCM 9152 TaxID=1236971 RepID=W4QF29_9BACI|nr:hypothetical protein [Halalkalibacter hemicellulosilyticus]GAE30268.1 hypothetical protein JCM9152_1670 [Halalkalibacter hemicellulosilyticusJCM 9152]
MEFETVAFFEKIDTSGFLVSIEKRVKPLLVKSKVLKKLICTFSVASKASGWSAMERICDSHLFKE